MRFIVIVLSLATLDAAGPGQVAIFECQGPVPYSIPVLPATDCEGNSVSATLGGNPTSTVQGGSNCGLPGPGGAQYAYLPANGDNGGSLTPPVGGPLSRPVSNFANQLLVAIPQGATAVTFLWEFFDGEGLFTGYNDAFEVRVVDAGGSPMGAPLVYIDTATYWSGGGSQGACADAGPLAAGFELGAPLGTDNGPQAFSGLLPNPLPALAYLSVVCCNGGDDSFDSAAAVDDFIFGFSPLCSLVLDQPTGPGSIRLATFNCTPGGTALRPVTFAQGSFPSGWCFGVDVSFLELTTQIAFGAPFVAFLDSTGGDTFFVPTGIPSGVPIYAGCGVFAPGGGPLIQVTQPLSLVTQ